MKIIMMIIMMRLMRINLTKDLLMQKAAKKTDTMQYVAVSINFLTLRLDLLW